MKQSGYGETTLQRCGILCY